MAKAMVRVRFQDTIKVRVRVRFWVTIKVRVRVRVRLWPRLG